jgi:hypothetical protein
MSILRPMSGRCALWLLYMRIAAGQLRLPLRVSQTVVDTDVACQCPVPANS